MIRALLLSAVLSTISLSPVAAQDILIRDATVHTLTARGTLKSTDVLIRDGRIAAVAQNIAAGAGVDIVDAGGRPLTPGLFAGLSAIGLNELSLEPKATDATLALNAPAWQQQWRPEFDVTRAYNPRSSLVPVTRIEGFTWTVLTPQNTDSILAGQGAAITLDGRFDAVLGGTRTLFVQMGTEPEAQSGGSRAAQFMLLEQAVREVRTKGPPGERALLHAAGREALAPYLAGGRVVFAVDRAADIHAVLGFARKHGIAPVISGGVEAWVVADALAQAKVPVILSPLDNLPTSFDKLGARSDNAALLHRAGVRLAFSEGGSHNARKIRQLAGNAVAHGLPWDIALKAVTASLADIFGLPSQGRVAVGQVADLVLWSGDPLEVTTAADQVWIAGCSMDMRSRQTELRDRYLERLKRQQTR